MKAIPVRHINNFSIRKLADLLDGKEMVQELHRHDFYYLLFIERGGGGHEIDFVAYEVGERCLFAIRPGQVHELRLNADTKGFMLQFNPDFYIAPDSSAAMARLRGAFSTNWYPLDKRRFDRLNFVLSDIYTEIGEAREEFESVVRAQLSILFIELLRANERRSPAGGSAHAQEPIERLLGLLEQHIFTHKKMTDYAEMMHLTAFQLNKITKETLGKTCSELIDEQTLLESKRLLLATPYLVNQIAHHLGYADVSYFTRFFRKHTGYTPEAFRQKFR